MEKLVKWVMVGLVCCLVGWVFYNVMFGVCEECLKEGGLCYKCWCDGLVYWDGLK